MNRAKRDTRGILLVVDIGNTTIHLGIFRGRALLRDWRLPTRAQKTVQGYHSLLKDIFFKTGINAKNIKDSLICSVVPGVCKILRKSIGLLLRKRPLIIGEDLSVPLNNLYRSPRQVGSDRLVGAFAASQLYGAPIIIVDFGTAITFDMVSKNKEYLGGMIVPGIETSLEALSAKAALLPKIELKRPKEVLGRDTVSSMTSGIIYGFSSLTDGLITRLKNEFDQNINSIRDQRKSNQQEKTRLKVVATGGLASLIFPYCKNIDSLDQKLILSGLRIIYNQSRK